MLQIDIFEIKYFNKNTVKLLNKTAYTIQNKIVYQIHHTNSLKNKMAYMEDLRFE